MQEVPLEELTEPEGQSEQAALPVDVEIEPSGHLEHASELSMLVNPEGHAMHSVTLA
jgi:hypothetical protein